MLPLDLAEDASDEDCEDAVDRSVRGFVSGIFEDAVDDYSVEILAGADFEAQVVMDMALLPPIIEVPGEEERCALEAIEPLSETSTHDVSELRSAANMAAQSSAAKEDVMPVTLIRNQLMVKYHHSVHKAQEAAAGDIASQRASLEARLANRRRPRESNESEKQATEEDALLHLLTSESFEPLMCTGFRRRLRPREVAPVEDACPMACFPLPFTSTAPSTPSLLQLAETMQAAAVACRGKQPEKLELANACETASSSRVSAQCAAMPKVAQTPVSAVHRFNFHDMLVGLLDGALTGVARDIFGETDVLKEERLPIEELASLKVQDGGEKLEPAEPVVPRPPDGPKRLRGDGRLRPSIHPFTAVKEHASSAEAAGGTEQTELDRAEERAPGVLVYPRPPTDAVGKQRPRAPCKGAKEAATTKELAAITITKRRPNSRFSSASPGVSRRGRTFTVEKNSYNAFHRVQALCTPRGQGGIPPPSSVSAMSLDLMEDNTHDALRPGQCGASAHEETGAGMARLEFLPAIVNVSKSGAMAMKGSDALVWRAQMDRSLCLNETQFSSSSY